MSSKTTQHIKASLCILAILVLFATNQNIHAQVTQDSIVFDTIETVRKGSIFKGKPGKSFLFSMIIPGSGQLYNKSYWRVPVVWAAVGGMGYVLHRNTCQYTCARDAYIAEIDGVADYVVPEKCATCGPPNYKSTLQNGSASTLRNIRDNANENRQLAIIGFSLVWLANGIDAFVDAHLKTFDVDDDLSFDFSPRIDDDPYAPMRIGVFLTLK
jgi:hypothetical protein